MKKYFQFNLCLVFIVALGGVIRADVALPAVGEQIRVEVAQNYPDHQFYIASYRRETKPDPDSPHESRPDMAAIVTDSFQLNAIELTSDQPYIQSVGAAQIRVNRQNLAESAYWLVAVKKGVAGAETKIKNAIDQGENTPEVVSVRLADTFEVDIERALGAKVIVNQVTGLTADGLEMEVSEGSATLPNAVKPANSVGFGLLLTGLAFFGFWWNRRRYA